MIAKEILIGFLVAIVATLAGMFFYIMLFSPYEVEEAILLSIEEGVLGNVIALGAILNFLPFFVFLKKHQYYRARGVIIASLLAAITVAVLIILGE